MIFVTRSIIKNPERIRCFNSSILLSSNYRICVLLRRTSISSGHNNTISLRCSNSRRFHYNNNNNKKSTNNGTTTNTTTETKKSWFDKSKRDLFDKSTSITNQMKESIERGDAINKFKDSVNKISNQSKSNINSEKWQQLSNELKQTSSSISQRAFDSAKNVSASALSSAKTTVSTSFNNSINTARDVTKSTIINVKDRAKNKTKQSIQSIFSNVRLKISSTWFMYVKNPIQERWKKVRNIPLWRRFWWWSLAAIFVYGIATTVPKELIRQQMEDKSSKSSYSIFGNSGDDNENDSNKNKQTITSSSSFYNRIFGKKQE